LVKQGRIRAAVTQALLRSFERTASEDELAQVTLTLGGAEVLEDIRGATAFAWTDVALHMRLAQTVAASFGSVRTVACWRGALGDTAQRAILRTFVGMAATLFGSTPHALASQADRLYRHLTEDLGELTAVRESEHRHRIELRGFPAHVWPPTVHLGGLQGGLEAMLDVYKAHGGVTVDRVDPVGEADLTIWWR
jgi:hypothetical protein